MSRTCGSLGWASWCFRWRNRCFSRSNRRLRWWLNHRGQGDWLWIRWRLRHRTASGFTSAVSGVAIRGPKTEAAVGNRIQAVERLLWIRKSTTGTNGIAHGARADTVIVQARFQAQQTIFFTTFAKQIHYGWTRCTRTGGRKGVRQRGRALTIGASKCGNLCCGLGGNEGHV